MHNLTRTQKLFDGEDYASRDRERLDALTHDDRSLMEEIGSARKNIFDTNKRHVPMCILNPYVSDHSHRFPKYVTDSVSLLDKLQTQMTSGTLPEVSPRKLETVNTFTNRA